ncbi:hypothetical protein DU500_13405 [Haloplanus rubicundus]|uniref:Uncharacterized protein n=1 Tax=Haloplanus rubicundus TaxID=1547898 RepID=A0A345E567_9EURY|nr:hypothetical protein [Haloplanus rubicundus]AXG07339.1 hypothetical protein DU500_13405 [Haloplanus rubicundus]
MSRSPPRAVAARLAGLDRLPTAQRAILGYYAETGRLDYRALRIKSAVDDTLDTILESVYGEIESEIAAALGVEDVTFAYETKLTLPAELTLGYLYRRALARATGGYDPITDEAGRLPFRGDPSSSANREAREYVEMAEEATALIVQALLDGDMRDAINDDEFEDFEVELVGDPDPDRRRVAECAQSYLQGVVEDAFDRAPDAVRDAYDAAVEISEAHQAQDEGFRDLLAAALEGDAAAKASIEDEYKYAPVPDDAPFGSHERDLPYLKTQYDRVGVIYKGMLDAYRGVGFEIPEAFGTSIVLAIIGAQLWLDDVDDYHDDVAEGQLTPVTAEYVLADSDAAAYDNVVSITMDYFDLAREHAEAADSPLNGIAIEYILRSGDPERLPGGSSRGA